MSKRKPSGEAPGAPSSSSHRTSSPSASAYIMSDRGRSVSPAPVSRAGSRPPTDSRSPSRGPPGQPGYPPPMGKDPARLEAERTFTRVELPAEAYTLDRPDIFAARPKPPSAAVGQACQLEVNSYRVTSFDFSKKVHQYSVSISPLPSKPNTVLKKIWAHPTFKARFPAGVLERFIFDGRSLAWASVAIPNDELRCMVDLDEGKDEPRKGGQAQFYITVKKSTEINMAVLDAYVKQKISLDNSILEAMNFIDHLLRATPSETLLSIKRNFYNPRLQGRPLMDGAVVEVHKGLYWSARISGSGIGLAINADVANTAFFVAQPFLQLVIHYMATQDRRLRGLNPVRLEQELRPVTLRGSVVRSEAFKQLRKLSKLKITVNHANRPEHLKKPIGIKDFTFEPRLGPEGSHARNNRFEHAGKTMSVEEYFRQKYNVHLQYPNLPLIDTGKGLIPMELATLIPMQRYPFKLGPDQVAGMIKIAVTRPAGRRADIARGVQDLQIQNDPHLRHFGVQIEPQFTKTEGYVLPPPVVHFREGSVDPKFSGRWNIQGKKLWKAGAPLDSWGFLVTENCVNKPTLEKFAKTFCQIFRGHGGVITQDPMLLIAPGNVAGNAANAVQWAHEQITARGGYTRLLFIVVPRRGDPSWERIKKSADCRQGFLSQVVAANGVQAAQAQYCSNVTLKVNAKLGGSTARTQPPWVKPNTKAPTYFPANRPTMIIGCDVTHGAPGSGSASVAAMTMNVDADANRFCAAAQTNGRRQEMLSSDNCHSLLGQLIQYWKAGHPNQFPAHLIYLRDGVSEGQFAKVLDMEIAQFKSWFSTNVPKFPVPKVTCVVVTKRHHVRFFPRSGDRNGNALPGTVLEKDVTNPRAYEYYMTSHSAIQGTARPCHYHVLMDEMHVPMQDLQRMMYEQCYSFARSTTPISMAPAIYYAHLAGARARAHENLAASAGPISGGKGHEAAQINLAKGASVSSQPEDSLPLLPLGGRPAGDATEREVKQRLFTRGSMWFI